MTPSGGLTTDDYVRLGYVEFMKLYSMTPAERLAQQARRANTESRS